MNPAALFGPTDLPSLASLPRADAPPVVHLYVALTLLILGASAARIVYNVCIHPLAKYPGPPLAAAVGLVYHYHFATGSIVSFIQDCHNKYGEVVRVGPDRLSFIHPDAWKDIYGHKASKDRSKPIKDPEFFAEEINGRHSILTVPSDADHASLRKIFSNAFSDRALKTQEPLIRGYVDKLIRNIRKVAYADPDAKVDLVKLHNCTTFDVIGDLAFGEGLGLLDNSEYNAWLADILGSLKAAGYRTVMFEYPLLGRIVEFFMPQKLKDQERESFEYSGQRVERRMAKGQVTEKPDFWSLVLAKQQSVGLDIEDMKANANLFMLAGSETTATALSGLTYNLLMNRDKMKELVHEIRSSFANEEELTIENIAKLKYLAACFEESLRLYPAVPLGPPRMVPQEGTVVMGNYVPPKTRVTVAQFAAYHSPVNFKDPDSFVPERWMSDRPEYAAYEQDRKSVLQPFSIGPRNCIGKNLAHHEMRLIMAKMLWHFDLELSPENRGTWPKQRVFSALWEKLPLLVKAKPIIRFAAEA